MTTYLAARTVSNSKKSSATTGTPRPKSLKQEKKSAPPSPKPVLGAIWPETAEIVSQTIDGLILSISSFLHVHVACTDAREPTEKSEIVKWFYDKIIAFAATDMSLVIFQRLDAKDDEIRYEVYLPEDKKTVGEFHAPKDVYIVSAVEQSVLLRSGKTGQWFTWTAHALPYGSGSSVKVPAVQPLSQLVVYAQLTFDGEGILIMQEVKGESRPLMSVIPITAVEDNRSCIVNRDTVNSQIYPFDDSTLISFDHNTRSLSVWTREIDDFIFKKKKVVKDTNAVTEPQFDGSLDVLIHTPNGSTAITKNESNELITEGVTSDGEHPILAIRSSRLVPTHVPVFLLNRFGSISRAYVSCFHLSNKRFGMRETN